MTISTQIATQGLVKSILDAGGSIHPLIIPAKDTNGTGLMNPSVYVDGNEILCILRHVNYTLYHSENKRFQHRFGPLQYLHPENDPHLRTWNYLLTLNADLSIKACQKIDTSRFDQEPLWTFVGLEDARLFRWNQRLYISGVRRDTTTTGQGRMELSELEVTDHAVTEIARTRVPAPGSNDTYCEKNWMPILDHAGHYIKWSNPTEVVQYDPASDTCVTVALDQNKSVANVPAFRGSSHVIPYGDYYLACTHEVDLFKSPAGEKDAVYRHRLVVWDQDWNMVRYTDPFSFMGADIEFCCGAAWHDDHLMLSFGFQDNAAFILKMPRHLVDEIVWPAHTPWFSDINDTAKNFDWGKMARNTWFFNTVSKEVFVDKVYEKFFEVEPGDTVLDVGASVGPFSWSVAHKKPKQLICLEPEIEFYQTLEKNLAATGVPFVVLNKALGAQDGTNYVAGLYDETKQAITDGTDGSIMETIAFDTLVREHNLQQIDFLKTDCEGGEYDIFNEKNFGWIQRNVKKITGEFHLNTPELKAKFRKFRDLYLANMVSHRIFSMDNVDIKHDLWSDWFIEHYMAITIYIDNRVLLEQKTKINTFPWPTLEITTIVPEKGCVVDCVFCPQRVLEQAYQGERTMTVDSFATMIDTVPPEVRITFSGFIEPWMNKNCTDMLLLAHDRGHPVSVFTTGVGLSVADLERIAHVPFAGGPNGGFTLHLPDSELLARHPITPGFIRSMEWLSQNRDRIQNFYVMNMGHQVHDSVRHLFDWAPKPIMWGRAGNLSRESVLKPELAALASSWQEKIHTDGVRTCGCVEHLYHNVLLPNGDVSLCCMDYGLNNIIGNLKTQTYEQVIPQAQTCYDICTRCENGAHPAPQPVKFYP